MSSNEDLFIRIGAYVDGELPEAERDEVESLIATSSGYRQAAESFQWLDQIAGGGAPPAVSAGDWVRVKEGALVRISRGEHARAAEAVGPAVSSGSDPSSGAEIISMPARRRWSPVVAVAAAALVVASLGIGIFDREGPGVSSTPDSGGDAIGPGQASTDAVEHLGGPRPTTIEIDEDGGASRVYYEDF